MKVVISMFVTVKLLSVFSTKHLWPKQEKNCKRINFARFISGSENSDKSEMFNTYPIPTPTEESILTIQSTSLPTATQTTNTALTTITPTKHAKEIQNTTCTNYSSTQTKISSSPFFKVPTIDLGHSHTLLQFGMQDCNCSRKLSTFRKVLTHFLFD